MSSSLATAVSGLSAYNELISIIANNITNSGTTAYKASSVSFIDLLNQSLSASSAITTGSGVSVSKITTDWTQGSTSSTSSATNLAINGSGFFLVKDTDGTGTTYYTRNGEFDFDNKGILTTADGLAVQGYKIDDNGNLGALGNIAISYEATSPTATSELTTSVSLNSELAAGNTFSTTITVYDSLGNEIPITITYKKSSANNEWTWEASISSAYGSLDGDKSGSLTFDANGKLTDGTDPVFSLTLTNGAATDQQITWDIYNDDGSTNGSLVQYAGECILNDQDQDGVPSVSLSGIAVNEDGYVAASYSNGTTKNLYRIALANFANYDGLKDVGNSLYLATLDSGSAVIGVPNTGQFGSISSECLELSNANLTSELADLITAQRAYQACARVFSVSDDIMETTVNLK